jgi:hypothetical protein
MAAVTLLARGAAAQGLYYKEVSKDGRIYVFNNADEAARFEQSGEMGRSITRLSAGPNGETVVANSERALELFFFKHGISEPVPQPPPAPPAPPWRLSGYMFGDYYDFASHNDPKWEGQQGLWFRRIYFTYDHTLSPKFTTRLRLEMNSNGQGTNTALTAYVKDAYLRWTYYGRQQMTLGIQPASFIDFADTFWGLRHIEKTPADLHRFDSSRDFGVSVHGPMNDSQTVKYLVQFGNESSVGSETDPQKALRLVARYDTSPGLALESVYAFMKRPADADRQTVQITAGYQNRKMRAAFQYLYQQRQPRDGTTDPTLNLDVYSGFAVFSPVPEKWTVFGRVDRFADPNPDGWRVDYLPFDTRAPYTFVVAGVEYYLFRSVRVSPNIEWVTYGDLPMDPQIKDTVVPRVTFYWIW